jgi:hypothetical protein
MYSVFPLSALAFLAIAAPAYCDDLDRYIPERPGPQTDFERAIEELPDRAREPEKYSPPDPHEGRLKVDKDYSVGGSIDPPEVNVRTTTP